MAKLICRNELETELTIANCSKISNNDFESKKVTWIIFCIEEGISEKMKDKNIYKNENDNWYVRGWTKKFQNIIHSYF